MCTENRIIVFFKFFQCKGGLLKKEKKVDHDEPLNIFNHTFQTRNFVCKVR